MRVPDLSGRVALCPHEDGRKSQANINSDNDEPNEPLDFRCCGGRNSEKGDSESGLAPGCGPDRPEARHVHDEEGFGPVWTCHVDIPAMFAKAHGGGDGTENAGDENGDLVYNIDIIRSV